MDPLHAIFSAFRNYGNLDGRASRSEYWWFYLFFVVLLVFIFIASLVWMPALLSVWVAYLVVMAPPLWSVTVRRLHDVGRPGTWALVGFLPLAGGPRMTRLLSRPGIVGPNRYGADPLRPDLGVQQSQWLADAPATRTRGLRVKEPGPQSACSRCGRRMQASDSWCANCGVANS